MPTGVQQTGAAVKFGVNQTFEGYIIQSRSRSKQARVTEEIVNEQGQTVCVIHAGFDEEIQLSMVVAAATAEPEVGQVLVDAAEAEFLIMSPVSIREENERAVIYDLTVKKFEGLDLTPGS